MKLSFLQLLFLVVFFLLLFPPNSSLVARLTKLLSLLLQNIKNYTSIRK